MLAFERPFLLAFLLLIPALIALRRLLRPRGLRFPIAVYRGPSFGGPPLPSRAIDLCRRALLWLGLAATIVAAAGPARVERRLLYLSRGNEVIFALDISPSMAASDFEPSRLEAAKSIIALFLSERRNESVGLVAFGGEAALVCPPTLDYDALRRRLSDLQPGALGEGTAIGSGIGTAVAHALRASAPEKYIVLLTDGENNAGSMAPATAVDLAARHGISVFVVGVGSKGEVPVSYLDPATGKRRTGTLRSDFDRVALESLARSGGGQYFAAANSESLASAFASLSQRSASLAKTRSVSSEESLVRPLLAAALLALIAARLLGLAGGGDFL
jgi:Ca-activated chloride channel family protein